MYSDLSMITIPEPLSSLVATMSSHFFKLFSAFTRALGGEGECTECNSKRLNVMLNLPNPYHKDLRPKAVRVSFDFRWGDLLRYRKFQSPADDKLFEKRKTIRTHVANMFVHIKLFIIICYFPFNELLFLLDNDVR